MAMCPCVLPVIAVTVLNCFLGMLWYSPFLLGSVWAKTHKFEIKTLKPTVWHYLGTTLVSLVTALVFAILIREFQLKTWKCGLIFALYAWLGFVVTTHFSGVIWARKPWLTYLIDITYLLLSFSMMGILLTVWICS